MIRDEFEGGVADLQTSLENSSEVDLWEKNLIGHLFSKLILLSFLCNKTLTIILSQFNVGNNNEIQTEPSISVDLF